MITEKHKILLLLWHPKSANAGGYIRIQEMLPHIQTFSFIVIDNYPSILNEYVSKNNLREYQIPEYINIFYEIHFLLGRFIEWTLSYFYLVKFGLEELRKSDFPIIYGPTGDIPHIMLAGVTLKIAFRSKKLLLDVLNLETMEMNWRNNIGFLLNRKSGIFQSKTFLEAFLALCVLFMQQRIINFCDFIVTVSPYMKRSIGKHFPSKKIAITPSGVKIVITSKNKKIKSYDGIYVGRYTAEKGIFDLLKTWREVLKYKKNSVLALLGFCDPEIKRRMVHMIHRYKLNDSVKFIGYVSEKEKWQYLRNSKIFIHLAHFEPLVPVITLLEASAAGLPVVMYNVSSLNDYPWMMHEQSLKVVKNGDYKKAAKEVMLLLKLKNFQRKALTVKSKAYASKFNWRRIAKIEESVISNLV